MVILVQLEAAAVAHLLAGAAGVLVPFLVHVAIGPAGRDMVEVVLAMLRPWRVLGPSALLGILRLQRWKPTAPLV